MSPKIETFALLAVLGFTMLFMSHDDAFAVCCFPYDMIHYIDPSTGNLVVSGELWNDSYKVEPFGNGKYDFVLINSTGDTLFEREILITDGHPIQNGFVINPHGAHPLPFQIVMEDIDAEILSQVAHVGTGRTSVDYFSWKPADLNATVKEFKKIETIQGKTHDALFDKWQVRGIITNTYHDATQNVYVLASLYDSDDRLVGVAGYSNDDIHPITLNGHETKEFKIHALVPQEQSVEQVRLYAESDNFSMKYPNTKPIIIKPDPPIRHGMEGTSIPIHVNVTNISRENVTFDWILQIKKSPKNLDEGDITKYPESKVVFIDAIPINVTTQESRILEYLWIPKTEGIYFYEMYLLDEGKPVSLSFAGSSFLYSDQILVTSNSLKDQLTSGTSFENLQCMNDLVLIQRHNESPACVTPETKTKLIDRGWIEESVCHGCGERFFENYKINCDNQLNPYQEYECFNDAYSHCEIATVNPEIYTIEGDPIYTTLTVTPDCKIQGVADMSTDRFWGEPEIIITTCDTIERDEYSWSADNCDARQLPEMQFNFMMQMYPQILECEENGNMWSDEKLECVVNMKNEN